MNTRKLILLCICLLTAAAIDLNTVNGQGSQLDEKVRKFLSAHEGKWHDLNVPSVDGQALYDIIIKGNYRNALEIGTSTGHSSIWIAWALSKTGGKLITSNYTTTLNSQGAGLSISYKKAEK